MATGTTKNSPSTPAGGSLSDLTAAVAAGVQAGFAAVSSQVAGGGGAPASALPGVEPSVGMGSRTVPAIAQPGVEAAVGAGGPTPEHPSGGAVEPSPHAEGGEKGEEGFKPSRSFGEFWGRIKDNAFEEKIGFAYPAIELGTGLAKRVTELDSGQYVTPEERQKALAEGTLPGLGGMIGAAIGVGTLGPAGGLLGGVIGQGVGEFASASIGASAEKHEATREASERLAASLGAAEESVSRFRAAMEGTGAPVKQLEAGLGLAQGAGVNVGGAAITGAGQMALAEGTDFLKNMGTVGGFLSQPSLYGLRQEFAEKGSALSSDEYRNVAGLAIDQGNLDAYNSAMAGAQATRYKNDPEWQKREKELKDNQSSWLHGPQHWWHGLADTVNAHTMGPGYAKAASPHFIDPVDDAQAQLDKRQEEIDEENKRRGETGEKDKKRLLERGAARFDVDDSGLVAGNAIDEYRVASLRGDSPAQLTRRLPQIKAALDAGSDADQRMIDQDQNTLKGLADDDPLRNAYKLEISALRDDQTTKKDIRFQEFQTSLFEDTLKGQQAEFGLEATRARLGGASASKIAGIVGREAHYLETVQGPMSPAEEGGLRQEAVQMRYAAKMGVYDEKLGGLDLGVEKAGLGVQKAESFGSVDSVATAGAAQIDALKSKLAELTSEIQKGGLAVEDRTAKERQAVQVQGQIAQQTAEMRDFRVSSETAMDADRLTVDTAGLGRQIRRGGNAAADVGALAGDYKRQIADDDWAVAQYAPGSRGRADAEARRATDREGYDRILDVTNAYTPSGAEERKLIEDQGAFQRSALAPFMDGPDSNPLTRGNALLGDYKSRLGGLEANRKAKQAAGTWRDEDETGYDVQKNALEGQVAGLQHAQLFALFDAVPEAIIGGAGGGLGGATRMSGAASSFLAGGPNPLAGSWGRPPAGHGNLGSGEDAPRGGRVGAFSDAGSSAVVAAIKELIGVVRGGGRVGSGGPPDMNGGVAARALSLSTGTGL